MSVAPGASASDIEAAAAALRAGELVAFPTETVYGLGADARNPDALRRVYALKGRPAEHPLILHLGSIAQLSRWAHPLPADVARLAAAFWPGPLTLVLPRHPDVSLVLTGGQDSIAVRVPAHPVAQALLAAFGGGIAAPSANRYGHVSPTTAEHVREEFPEGLRVLEGGECEVGLESTILSLLEEPPRILRPGMIGRSTLEAVLGRPLAGDVPTAGLDQRALPRVPGSTAAHYAPRTPLYLVAGDRWAMTLTEALAAGETPAVLARSAAPVGVTVRAWRCAPQDPESYGHALYALLRELDKLDASCILVEQVPDTEPWEAIRDRLTRAARGRGAL